MRNYWLDKHKQREDDRRYTVTKLVKSYPDLAKFIAANGLCGLHRKERKKALGNRRLSMIDEIMFQEDLRFILEVQKACDSL